MKCFIAAVAMLALIGCDSQSNQPDASSALVYIDGKVAEASATVSQQELDGTTYRVITLDIENGRRVEIVGLSFVEGRFTREDAAGTDFPFSFIYTEDGDQPAAFLGRHGSIEISLLAPTRIEGEFEFETRNLASSCMECEEAIGPSVRGSFSVVQSGR